METKAFRTGFVPAALALALLVSGLLLCGCSASGESGEQAAALFGSGCKPFDPDVTNSCLISSERWSEIPELPKPPYMYRYCAWPGLLSGAYRTRYRDLDGSIHDFTDAPAMTPSFLLQAFRGADNGPATQWVDYRLMPMTHPCPGAPPGQPDFLNPRIAGGNLGRAHPPGPG